MIQFIIRRYPKIIDGFYCCKCIIGYFRLWLVKRLVAALIDTNNHIILLAKSMFILKNARDQILLLI